MILGDLERFELILGDLERMSRDPSEITNLGVSRTRSLLSPLGWVLVCLSHVPHDMSRDASEITNLGVY